ncbi:leucine-rich repeat-containing protein let-4 [Parasteatoda tepidariorum]|uniref:leucine-rich repeat-containing protein let-4 n=1 Tax=Parasteatoda tepidariorum TaxID=114398 RepID=UPI001C727FF5|nr:leucine-rich repeat-containing protein 4 [Parasteatoda tepidariorum]
MLLLIQVFLAIAATAFAIECPPSDKLYPCSCEEDEGHTIVQCEGSSLSELEPAVKNTVGHNVSFYFTRCNLGDIPSDFFKGHISARIQFQQCVVTSFGETPFSGLENSLEALYIYSTIDRSVTKMDNFNLKHLQKLRYFSAAYNDIGDLGDHWFEGGPASLTQVDLDGNKIESVGATALVSLVNLQQLYVGENQIKYVSRSVLPNPTRDLWLIEAKSNLIEDLPENTFDGYPILKIVNLAQNKLKSIPENVWGKVWSQLESVYLEGNDIVCDANIKWIYSQKLPNTFDGKCGPGNDLEGRELKSLKLEDFE